MSAGRVDDGTRAVFAKLGTRTAASHFQGGWLFFVFSSHVSGVILVFLLKRLRFLVFSLRLHFISSKSKSVCDVVCPLSSPAQICGTPNDDNWPTHAQLPGFEACKPSAPLPRTLRERFTELMNKGNTCATPHSFSSFGFLPAQLDHFLPVYFPPPISPLFSCITPCGIDLLDGLLALDPSRRLSAKDAVLHAFFFDEPPLFKAVLAGCVWCVYAGFLPPRLLLLLYPVFLLSLRRSPFVEHLTSESC